jgi:two-component system, NarL family, nitrate/nitrite response regulator NarL
VKPTRVLPVRVVVADDHPLYREGLIGAIRERPMLEVVGEAADGAAALRLIATRSPDVALLDVKMQVDGPSVLKRLRTTRSQTAVVFLSAYLDSALVYSALEAGAAGFLSKAADRAAICDAIERSRAAKSCCLRRPRPCSARRFA